MQLRAVCLRQRGGELQQQQVQRVAGAELIVRIELLGVHGHQDATIRAIAARLAEPDRAGALAQQVHVVAAEEAPHQADDFGTPDDQIPVVPEHIADDLQQGRADGDLDVHLVAGADGVHQRAQAASGSVPCM
ncbi:hypothetical protein [uncultured Thiohalocapsa sp.]|uniref:hypothetical protein n=1 Tax=uncultured Thiohalocapsa sp. TaxID=768990 RepID=UPI0025DA83BC|nr:hypothetical protein [uncultured Thiohalocapsa sp.]